MKIETKLIAAALALTVVSTIVPARGEDLRLRHARVERYFVELEPDLPNRDWFTFGDLTFSLQCRRVNIDPPQRNAAIMVTSERNSFYVAAPGNRNLAPGGIERAPGDLLIVHHADFAITGEGEYIPPQRDTQHNSIVGTGGEVVLIEGFIGNDLDGSDTGCTFVGTLVRFRG